MGLYLDPTTMTIRDRLNREAIALKGFQTNCERSLTVFLRGVPNGGIIRFASVEDPGVRYLTAQARIEQAGNTLPA
jgi:hypothetical protein